ncbi:hypothetical protein FB567DRAFT_325119 [Paraphoma chrysanthemicola]|uniref:Uncharacterized protein n=1 Tax=Paraphoma chrysanthemicola TaxID=798071 RepID=A0A8K0RBL0_9PLEO|nr:hypothetical protein FB567DRAFT_325119 [Paraphoma chrysanthemicola]
MTLRIGWFLTELAQAQHLNRHVIIHLTEAIPTLPSSKRKNCCSGTADRRNLTPNHRLGPRVKVACPAELSAVTCIVGDSDACPPTFTWHHHHPTSPVVGAPIICATHSRSDTYLDVAFRTFRCFLELKIFCA